MDISLDPQQPVLILRFQARFYHLQCTFVFTVTRLHESERVAPPLHRAMQHPQARPPPSGMHLCTSFLHLYHALRHHHYHLLYSITVKKLKPDTNVPLLASTIMQRSGTIPASQLPTVELLLYQLQARQYGNLVRHPSLDDSRVQQGLSAAQQDAQRMLQQDHSGEDARLEDLQEYIV